MYAHLYIVCTYQHTHRCEHVYTTTFIHSVYMFTHWCTYIYYSKNCFLSFPCSISFLIPHPSCLGSNQGVAHIGQVGKDSIMQPQTKPKASHLFKAESCCLAQAGLGLVIFLSLPPKPSLFALGLFVRLLLINLFTRIVSHWCGWFSWVMFFECLRTRALLTLPSLPGF